MRADSERRRRARRTAIVQALELEGARHALLDAHARVTEVARLCQGLAGGTLMEPDLCSRFLGGVGQALTRLNERQEALSRYLEGGAAGLSPEPAPPSEETPPGERRQRRVYFRERVWAAVQRKAARERKQPSTVVDDLLEMALGQEGW